MSLPVLPASALADMPVLVFDPETGALDATVTLLRQLGFADIEASTKEDAALRRLARRDFALILMDAAGPPIVDYELLTRRSADGLGARTPILMTGRTTDASAALSGDAFLPKPFSRSTLRGALSGLLGTG